MAEALAPTAGYHLLQPTADLESVYGLGVQGILHLALVDYRLNPEDPLAPVREMKRRLPEVPVVVFADPSESEYIRRALLAGARAFLPLDFTPPSLTQTLDDLSVELAVGPGKAGPPGRLITVFSLKGGVGRTLIATNLAVALRGVTDGPVALVDGQMAYGDVEIALNLRPQHTIADLMGQLETLEPEVMDAALVRHASGLRVLAAADSATDAERMHPGHLVSILRVLRRQYPWVVVDTGSWLDDRLEPVLEASDTILLVTTPEMTSLRAARIFLQMAREQGYSPEKIRLVVNRADLVGGVPDKEIQRNLGVVPFALLADDSPLVTYSLNRGVPLVESHARKPLARVIRQMAEVFVKEVAPASAGKAKAGMFGGLRGGR